MARLVFLVLLALGLVASVSARPTTILGTSNQVVKDVEQQQLQDGASRSLTGLQKHKRRQAGRSPAPLPAPKKQKKRSQKSSPSPAPKKPKSRPPKASPSPPPKPQNRRRSASPTPSPKPKTRRSKPPSPSPAPEAKVQPAPAPLPASKPKKAPKPEKSPKKGKLRSLDELDGVVVFHVANFQGRPQETIEECNTQAGLVQARAFPDAPVTDCVCCPNTAAARRPGGCGTKGGLGSHNTGGFDAPTRKMFKDCDICSAMAVCTRCRIGYRKVRARFTTTFGHARIGRRSKAVRCVKCKRRDQPGCRWN